MTGSNGKVSFSMNEEHKVHELFTQMSDEFMHTSMYTPA